MIYHCMLEGRYSMTADVYKPVKTQDSKTGEIKNTWSYDSTIPCYAWGLAASGKDMPGTYEKFDAEYTMFDTIRMISRDAIHKDHRVANIRNADGTIWSEDYSGLATVFDARGSVPIVDSFGKVVEHTTMLTRSEVQSVPPEVLQVQGASQGGGSTL